MVYDYLYSIVFLLLIIMACYRCLVCTCNFKLIYIIIIIIIIRPKTQQLLACHFNLLAGWLAGQKRLVPGTAGPGSPRHLNP